MNRSSFRVHHLLKRCIPIPLLGVEPASAFAQCVIRVDSPQPVYAVFAVASLAVLTHHETRVRALVVPSLRHTNIFPHLPTFVKPNQLSRCQVLYGIG